MAFDEVGQADTVQRKVNICERAYKLLVKDGTDPNDIVFDPNIFAIATGIAEHGRDDVDFIEGQRKARLFASNSYGAVRPTGGHSRAQASLRELSNRLGAHDTDGSLITE